MDRREKPPVVLLYAMDRSWSEEEKRNVVRESRRLGFAMRRQGHSVHFQPVSDPDIETLLSAYSPQDVVVFNWCEDIPGLDHGEPAVVEALESLCFTYTGASADTLRLSYDKARVKRLLEEHGVPTPRWMRCEAPPDNAWDCFPAIVKPACEHCSLGVDEGAVVMNANDLRDRVSYVLKEFNQPALVEDFIDGREFHVPVWGNETIEVLPSVEMDFSGLTDIHDRLCSYDAKFVPESRAYRQIRTFVPARLTEEETRRIEECSKAAYEAIGCRDYGRIDVRLRNGVFYVLDVNPNADISADASVALAAGKAGYSYGAMGSRVLELATRRLRADP